jgi:hypothetical protein
LIVLILPLLSQDQAMSFFAFSSSFLGCTLELHLEIHAKGS